MAEAINANPTVFDVSELPTRLATHDDKGVEHRNQQFLKNMAQLTLGPVNGSLDAPLTAPGLSDDDSDSDGDDAKETIDEQEIFDLISSISDPEHPLSLAQLAVVNLQDIKVTHGTISEVLIKITPTITHCSLATLIGLGIRVRLERCLPPRFRIRILIKEGTHQSENQVNKQLNDKERVAAACENNQLLSVISQMLSTCK
ncbi:hypothetical protein DIURU_002188 [Diutina rugosa]|uniref:MIP18 family-like domain-containing protein n=1 Tax=Diutina rugosa TaxID=5481 RepID=A0A642UQQ0_DIURU|nr:uncharacterized protein DIURU_002188 [Diutina rugosa]KAA8903677.1 hypothetical protein DIURU_002188 [Diutina rugosa]